MGGRGKSISLIWKNFIFNPILMGFFPKNSSWKMQQKLPQEFFCSIFQFLYKRGQRVKKLWFCRRWEIFIFHPILMWFFAFDSSQWELSVVCQQIFSIFYRFQDKMGQSSGGGGIQFRIIWKIFYFEIDFDGFFPNDSS